MTNIQIIKGLIVEYDEKQKVIVVYLQKDTPRITIGQIRTIENSIKQKFNFLISEDSYITYDIDNHVFIFRYEVV